MNHMFSWLNDHKQSFFNCEKYQYAHFFVHIHLCKCDILILVHLKTNYENPHNLKLNPNNQYKKKCVNYITYQCVRSNISESPRHNRQICIFMDNIVHTDTFAKHLSSRTLYTRRAQNGNPGLIDCRLSSDLLYLIVLWFLNKKWVCFIPVCSIGA